MIEKQIFEKISNYKDSINNVELPQKPGLYGIFLRNKSSLSKFARGGDIIYLGKAERNLRSRDLSTHFNSGRTGSSTVRRSIGAILKSNLNLAAMPRSVKRTDTDFYNYKFSAQGEIKLTNWMISNLEVGVFVPNSSVSKVDLGEFEEKMLKFVKPPLDLDPRTKHLNKFANEIQRLRAICREEAERN